MDSDSEHWQELQELFELAEATPRDERVRVLTQACPDRMLRERVQALLRAAELTTHASPASERQRIGAYTILRLIGSGGVGSVYLAQRTIAGEIQRVALKILAPHAAGHSFVDRFAREQRILAALDHPSITRLLDAGISDIGQPYLVMEYVEGEHLDVYCESRNLDRKARLALFSKICVAAGYAHRALVVHLDLKPSNILVTAEGMPKLLDFGTAKLLEPDRKFTATVMATPAYASPEQLRQEPVTTASDIYSLGMILFELTTGKRPEQGRGDSATTYGDLSTIIGKCLAPLPQERYATVDALAGDIERYVNGRPILARPQTLAYRVRKFVLRNPWNVALATLFVAGMTGAVVYSSWQARVAERQVELLRGLAEGRYVALGQYSRWLRDSPSTADLEQIRVSVESIPTNQFTPRLHRILGDCYESLGRSDWSAYGPSRMEPEAAMVAYRKAMRELELATGDENPQGVLVQRSVVAMELSAVMAETGSGSGSFAVVVGPILDLLQHPQYDELGAHYDVLSDRLGKKTRWARQPDFDAAPELLRKLLKIPLGLPTDLAAVELYEHSKASPADPVHPANPLVDLQLGRLMAESGQPEEGRKLLEAALAGFGEQRKQSLLLRTDSDVTQWDARAAGAHGQLGRIDEAEGRFAAALDQYEAARKGLEAVFEKTRNPYYLDRVALASLHSARLLTRLGQRQRALPLAKSAAETLRQVAATPGMAAERLELIAYSLLTLEPAEARDRAAALTAAEAAVRRSKRQMPSYLVTLAVAQFASGHAREAEATAIQAVPVYRKALTDLGPLFGNPELKDAKRAYDSVMKALR